MSIARSTILAALLVACGAEPAETPAPAETPPSAGEETPPRPGEELRALEAGATFADLLAAARTLDDRRDQASDAGCLVRRLEGGWRLEADLAVAVRPLPEPPSDLDERLAEDGAPANVLTRWGAYGSGAPENPSFVAVTSTLPPAREPAMVWVVTERGTYARSTQTPSSNPMPGSPHDAVAALGDPEALGALFITADASLPLSRLADALAQVPDGLAGRVGLAVALAPNTRLPAPAEAEADADGALCPDGLPPLSEDAPVGTLLPQTIVSSLGPLRQGAEICVGTTGGAGGRVQLALRIGPDGRVAEACAISDDSGDARLRRCLVEAARAVAFPAPDPAGSVDVQLPLALEPVESQRQRALCR